MSDTTNDDAPALASDHRREEIVNRLRDDIGDALIEFDIEPTVDLWVRVSPEAWADAIAALAARGFDYFVFLSAIDWMQSPWGQSEEDPFAPADEADDDAESDDDADDTLATGRAGGDTRFQVFARLTDIDERIGITIKADVPESLTVPTIIPTFAGANWHEREANEMFGIEFDGHPDLRNIYLPTDFEGFPMRKDFPLLARHIKPWPGIVDVEPLPETDEDAS